MIHFLFFLLFLFSPAVSFAQDTEAEPLSQPGWEQLFNDWMTLEDADYGENTFELLATLAENKLNLNQTTREQLEQFPFLSAQQVEDLMAYIDRYKPMRSLSELQMITSIDRDTRRLLTMFVFVGDDDGRRNQRPSLSSMLHDGRHTLLGTLKVPMYERKGDRSSTSKGYLGYRYRHDLRYQFNYKNQLKFGLTGAQDAGEPFFANRNRLGYDHYSYYFQWRGKGRLEELNLGMYRVQLGMGLVMNTGFHLGKLAMLQSLGRSAHVLTAHASRSSAGYLQGAAASLRLSKDWNLTVFASYRPLDATLNQDASVRTIVTDGYHRTATEMEKKNNTHLADLGFRVGWKPHVQTGLAFLNLNVVYSHFDRRIVPYTETSSKPTASQRYRQYALAGNDFLNASLDYSYTSHRLSFSGETALNRDGALAMIHTLSLPLSEQWALMLLHRYYDKRYTAFHAHSFSEGSGTQNEHGIYLGTSWRPSRATLLRAYVDYIHFPWVRYQVSNSSDAFDGMLLARTLLYNIVTLEGLYRFRLRQQDNTNQSLLQNRYEHRARLRMSIDPHPSLTLQTQVHAALVNSRTSNSRGIMLSQQAAWKHRWLQLNAMASWFHTDNYDSRLYQYEPSVRYDFSFPMYYGHGLHYALMARADRGRWMVAAKIGVTNYFDRSVISSGNQQIDHSSMADLLLQCRYQF